MRTQAVPGSTRPRLERNELRDDSWDTRRRKSKACRCYPRPECGEYPESLRSLAWLCSSVAHSTHSPDRAPLDGPLDLVVSQNE